MICSELYAVIRARNGGITHSNGNIEFVDDIVLRERNDPGSGI
jgi:hypothetical protein